MKKNLIYDLPTRIFHWSFALLFVGSFFIAKTVDDENPVFSLHMLAGLILAFIVGLRLIWGFIGTRYARFSSFALNPKDLVAYFKGILSGNKRTWPGHNPASSWVTILMLALALSLALTGVLMTTGQKETFEDMHELFANAFLVTAVAHVAGVLLHSLRHRDGIALSMIVGKKQTEYGETSIPSAKPLSAFVFVLLIALFSNYLYRNYNQKDKTLKVLGAQLSLGEEED